MCFFKLGSVKCCHHLWYKNAVLVERWYVFTCLLNTLITKTRLFKYIENFTTKTKENFQIKISDIFHNSAQNIDCGYSLEPPRRGGSNEYP